MRRLFRARRIAVAFAITGFAAPLLTSSVTTANSVTSASTLGPVDVNACVDYDETSDDDSVSVRLRSSCERPLRCEISWELSCANAAPRSGEAAFRLRTGATSVTVASASACGEANWSVDALSWSCVATQ